MRVFETTPDLFDENELSSALPRGEACRAGPGERIEHDIARLRERFDERLHDRNRLLGRMQWITGVVPFQHILERLCWSQRSPLGEEVNGFVVALRVALSGRIFFHANQVAHRRKSDPLPRSQKLIRVRPAVEAHAKTVWLKQPIYLRKGWFEPVALVVACNLAAVPR